MQHTTNRFLRKLSFNLNAICLNSTWIWTETYYNTHPENVTSPDVISNCMTKQSRQRQPPNCRPYVAVFPRIIKLYDTIRIPEYDDSIMVEQWLNNDRTIVKRWYFRSNHLFRFYRYKNRDHKAEHRTMVRPKLHHGSAVMLQIGLPWFNHAKSSEENANKLHWALHNNISPLFSSYSLITPIYGSC